MEQVEFEFINNEYELIEEVKNNIYIKIDRECRTTTFVGMKQPTPVGGILGYETILLIKHDGKPAKEYYWELFTENKYIASGITDENGICRSIPIKFPYGTHQAYKIRIYQRLFHCNKTTRGINMVTTEETMVYAIKTYIVDELTKRNYVCKIGSTHRDMTYINYINMIYVTDGLSIAHIDVNDIFNTSTISVYLYDGYPCKKTLQVDINEPDFGRLIVDLIEKLNECFTSIQEISS